MSTWKLIRLCCDYKEYPLFEGETSIGRGCNNNMVLSSIVVSRHHCVINIIEDKVTIRDLKSSNGTFVGQKKIIPNEIITIKENEVIGIGWTEGGSKIDDTEKYIFKLVKNCLKLQQNNDKDNSDNNQIEMDDIEAKLAVAFNECDYSHNEDQIANTIPDISLSSKQNFKRKSFDKENLQIEKYSDKKFKSQILDVVSLLSDSDSDCNLNTNKTKAESTKTKIECHDNEHVLVGEKHNIKVEPSDHFEYDAFKVKQEYLGYDEEPIQIDSDSDSDTESQLWYLRLSQNSPAKSIMTSIIQPSLKCNTTNNYTEYDTIHHTSSINDPEEEEFSDDLIQIPFETSHQVGADEIDSHCTTSISNKTTQVDKPINHISKIIRSPTRTAVMIEPKAQLSRKIINSTKNCKNKNKSISSHSKDQTKSKISTSQKEERKRKLKEIASKKNLESDTLVSNLNNISKQIVNVKVTNNNRGAFLTESTAVVKPTKRKDNSNDNIKTSSSTSSSFSKESNSKRKSTAKLKNIEPHSSECENVNKENHSKPENIVITNDQKLKSDGKVSLKHPKPLTDTEEILGKPISRVEPLPVKKPKKKVRFSTKSPEIRIFEIEPGHQMKKTSLVKGTMLDIKQKVSLEKIFLMRILRWNPQWLDEQIGNSDPPPILGHNNTPINILHSFQSHAQYVQIIGDLLLMEIWECVSQAYSRKHNQENLLKMQLESVPLVPSPERCFEVFNFSVNVSVPKAEMKSVPRIGELMLISFGSDSKKLFYVNNVRCLPSPQNNMYSYFSISLHATYTDKMRYLRVGEDIYGSTLSYIKNELVLIESMEYLAGSQLSEVILRPEAKHFTKEHNIVSSQNFNSQWTKSLNPSQMEAVACSVNAALSDRPSLQMVQGPPGTGKSSVICSIVMSYFYDLRGHRIQNRGKILICATSNAAVDELVIRLLNIRQTLPKSDRFRMVRVGRAEAMAARAREVCSQTLAQRDRRQQDAPGLRQEIAHLEAKINMWRSTTEAAKDPGRVAYCEERMSQVVKRINMLRVMVSSPGEQSLAGERRIIECADIIVTTLSSAANHKMKGLKRSIALCIVDEAGQAIEPEVLVPLTLDVTNLTLIGDPQQLPGYICSQRAKQYGLGESLFSRLSSYALCWENSPVVLLNTQYRMHPEIADYPNRAFYGGKILNSPTIRNDLPIPPYSLVFISSGDKGQNATGANKVEAWGVARLAFALSILLRPLDMSLAVITPYNAHKDMIRNCLRILQDTEPPVEVATVDSFQGQERDVVLASLARGQGAGFLADAGRVNVMLTRARRALLVCLDPDAMRRNNQWRTLIDDAQRRKMHSYIPSAMCRETNAKRALEDDILQHITRLSR